jgi:hypothetical protein
MVMDDAVEMTNSTVVLGAIWHAVTEMVAGMVAKPEAVMVLSMIAGMVATVEEETMAITRWDLGGGGGYRERRKLRFR